MVASRSSADAHWAKRLHQIWNHPMSHKSKWIAVCLIGVLAAAFGVFQFVGGPSSPVAKIGIAGWGSNPEFQRSIDGFKEGLAANGYVEGENVDFIILNSETDPAVQREIIEQFVDQEVDLIYTLTTFGTLTAMDFPGVGQLGATGGPARFWMQHAEHHGYLAGDDDSQTYPAAAF